MRLQRDARPQRVFAYCSIAAAVARLLGSAFECTLVAQQQACRVLLCTRQPSAQRFRFDVLSASRIHKRTGVLNQYGTFADAVD